MGLFDGLKNNKEAKKLGLTPQQYEEFLIAQQKNISIDEYKKYLAGLATRYSLEQFSVLLQLQNKGFNSQQCDRFLNELIGKVSIDECGDFLEAEKLGLSANEYIAYTSSMKDRMSISEYADFVKLQNAGLTMGQYLRYLRDFKNDFKAEDYPKYILAEDNGLDLEEFKSYINEFKDSQTIEQYIATVSSKKTGISTEEYELQKNAAELGLSVEEYKIRLEAQNLGLNDSDYKIYLEFKKPEHIIDGMLTIPKEYDKIPTHIFKLLDFNAVKFSDSINEIPAGAFEDCKQLKELKIPSFIKNIGENAFRNCTALKTVVFERGVEAIESCAFENCESLKDVIVTGSIKEVGFHAFSGCSSLRDLTFNSGVETINVSDLTSLKSLKSIKFPETASFLIDSGYTTKDSRVAAINFEQRFKIHDGLDADYISQNNYSDFGLFAHREEIEHLEVYGNFVFLELHNFPKLRTVVFHAKGCITSITNCPSIEMICYKNYYIDIPANEISTATNKKLNEKIELPNLKYLFVEDGAIWEKVDKLLSLDLLCKHISSSVKKHSIITQSKPKQTEISAVKGKEPVKETPSIKSNAPEKTSTSPQLTTLPRVTGDISQKSLNKLIEVTNILKQKYADAPIFNFAALRRIETDLPIETLNTWTRKAFNKTANEYLMEQGIIQEPEYLRAERLKKERYQAELSKPIQAEKYIPQVYNVEEINIIGEEANDWQISEGYYGREGEIIIDDYIGNKKHIIVPSFINGKKVSGFGPACFRECKAESIQIPGTIKKIVGTNGYGNDTLRSITIGEGVEVLGESFLSAASTLVDVKISKSVNTVDMRCSSSNCPFLHTPWFESHDGCIILGETMVGAKGDNAILNIPFGVKRISDNLNLDMPNLKKVIIPDTVESIGFEAFTDSYQIDEFVVPESVVDIGENAFGRNPWITRQEGNTIVINKVLYKYVTGEKSITIPNGITGIAGGVFKGNKKIQNVVFPKSLKVISQRAFWGCSSLTSVEFSEELELIGPQAFERCSSLKEVVIPNNVTEIADAAFSGCSALEKLHIGQSTKILGDNSFGGCSQLKDVAFGYQLQSIGRGAFSGCKKLKSLNIPNSVLHIGNGAFSQCEALEEFILSENIEVLYGNTFSSCRQLKQVALPKDLKEIKAYAFQNCHSLSNVIFADKVVEIGSSAFSNCQSIVNVALPNSIINIAESAFENCINLESVLGHENLKSIGKRSFAKCSNLSAFVIPSSVESIGEEAFADCEKLVSTSFKGTVSNIGLEAFARTPYLKESFGEFVVVNGTLTKYQGSNENVVIPDNVSEIGAKAFMDCQSIKTVIIPDSVISIGDKAFAGRTLKKVVIGNGVKIIGDAAFCECDELSEISFGSAVETVGKKAFSSCDSLHSVDFSSTKLKEISERAFEGCEKLSDIVFSESLEVIGDSAFIATNLDILKLPKSVKQVGMSSFVGVNDLIVYNTFDPDAVLASEWTYDKYKGSINSNLSCALIGTSSPFGDSDQRYADWYEYHITVLDEKTDDILYKVFCSTGEDTYYYSLMFSAWGKNASFKFDEYDSAFLRTINRVGRIEMAFCRLMYPGELSETHKKNYEDFIERCMYIKRSADRVSELIAKEDNVARLELLDKYNTIDEHNLSWIIAVFKKFNAKSCIEYLSNNFKGV